MVPFRRIMVVLDDTDDSQNLIRYAEFLAKIYSPEDLYFVHVVPDLETGLDFTVRFQTEQATVQPVDEEIAANLRNRIKRYFVDSSGVRLHVDILEGRTESQVEHWAGVKHADLVLIGRGNGGFDETVLIKRLVRHLPVSVMIVPAEAEPAIGQILVPVDFSEQSAKALFRAGELEDRLDDVTMKVFHAFEIPPGHFKISRTAKQFERIMRENTGAILDKFLAQSDATALRENAVLIPAKHTNPARDIQDYLVEEPADLVVVGAHGHGAVERFFIGSVTEGMLERSVQTAILVIK